MKTAIWIWIILNMVLFLISFRNVRRNKTKVDFIFHWAFLFGAFVWEDLMIFSLFYVASALFTLIMHDIRLLYLSFLLFWIVRSAGETLYHFLQQFIVPKHHPLDLSDHLQFMHFIFGKIDNQKIFIIAQVSLQILTMTCLILLTLLLMNWNSIPKML